MNQKKYNSIHTMYFLLILTVFFSQNCYSQTLKFSTLEHLSAEELKSYESEKQIDPVVIGEIANRMYEGRGGFDKDIESFVMSSFLVLVFSDVENVNPLMAYRFAKGIEEGEGVFAELKEEFGEEAIVFAYKGYFAAYENSLPNDVIKTTSALRMVALQSEVEHLLDDFQKRQTKEEEERIKAQKKKIEDIAKKASNGDANSQLEMGYMAYDNGLGDVNESIIWFGKAYKQGLEEASKSLHKIVRSAESRWDEDKDSSLATMELVGDVGLPYGYYSIATSIIERPPLSTSELEIKQNIATAIPWYEKAANNGHVESMESLGSYYYYAFDDVTKARHWYEMALSEGSISAGASLEAINDPLETVLRTTKRAIEYASDNKEIIIGALVLAGTAYSLSSVDEKCFRPNNEKCNGWQLKKHRNLYDRTIQHLKEFKPEFGKCGNSEQLASAIRGFADTMRYAAFETFYIAFAGEPSEILADIGELREAVAANNGC